MNWLREVSQARDARAVLEVVNEFLQYMPHYARESLAVPLVVTETPEVLSLHRRLSDTASIASGDDTLQESAAFFVRAAMRLIDLGATAAGETPCNPEALAARSNQSL